MRRDVLRGLLAGLLLLGPASRAAAPGEPGELGVGVKLELSQKFFYEHDPLWVRITVRNGGENEVDNPIESALTAGFRVEAVEGAALKPAAAPDVREPARPAKLAPRSFYGAVIDLARVFPGLSGVGTYRIHWSGKDLLSDMLTVRVIPKYDPTKRYTVDLETSEGTIQLGFFPDSAPIAVKAFIDMAQTGFYDGLLFQEIQADAFIAGGNPAFGEPRERHPFTYPAEQTRQALVSGSVVVKPAGAAPPSNGPEFLILLKPQPAWVGQVTVLGQVLKGFDVAQKISRLPSSGQTERPFFKPLKDVVIRRVRVAEVAAPAPGGP